MDTKRKLVNQKIVPRNSPRKQHEKIEIKQNKKAWKIGEASAKMADYAAHLSSETLKKHGKNCLNLTRTLRASQKFTETK